MRRARVGAGLADVSPNRISVGGCCRAMPVALPAMVRPAPAALDHRHAVRSCVTGLAGGGVDERVAEQQFLVRHQAAGAGDRGRRSSLAESACGSAGVGAAVARPQRLDVLRVVDDAVGRRRASPGRQPDRHCRGSGSRIVGRGVTPASRVGPDRRCRACRRRVRGAVRSRRDAPGPSSRRPGATRPRLLHAGGQGVDAIAPRVPRAPPRRGLGNRRRCGARPGGPGSSSGGSGCRGPGRRRRPARAALSAGI